MAVSDSAIQSFSKFNNKTNIQTDPINKIQLFLFKNGYSEAKELCKTLQGSIWLAKTQSGDKNVAIKVAHRELVDTSTARCKGQKMRISEDIKSEALVLQYLSSDSKCPNSIIQFIDIFKRYANVQRRTQRAHYKLCMTGLST